MSQKPCESCETNVKLRNLYLRNLAKLVFAKLAKHDLRNLAKHCETLIAKIAKVAKIEPGVALRSYYRNSLNNTVTTARLVQVELACQGSHMEMPQSATVARALQMAPNGLRSRLPQPKIAGREEIRRPRRRWEASDERCVACLARNEGGVIAQAAAVPQKGIVPLSPSRYSKRIPSTDSMGDT